MPRLCCFCRTEPARKNREHVLPDWLADVFTSRDPQIHYRRIQSPDGHHEKVYDQRLFRAKTTCTCSRCNHGWMSDTETAAKPLLVAMMLSPLSFVLSREDQVLIARWAFLRLLIFQQAQGPGPRAVPEMQYADFYEHRELPDGAQVWVGRRNREGAWPYRFLALAGDWRPGGPRDEPSAPEGFNVYQAALMVGHLAIYLSGRLDGGRPLVHSPDFRQELSEIWPAKPRLTWPPPMPVDYRRVEAMFSMEGRYVDRAA